MTHLTQEQHEILRALVGRMIPSSDRHGAPGADNAAIFEAVIAAIEAQPVSMRDMLSELLPEKLGNLANADVVAVTDRLRERHGLAFAALLDALARGYYSDDRVMESIGMEARPPFPKGFELEKGDWDLLKPVQARPPIWRA